MKACLISIGDELLIGQTINTNAAWLARKLGAIGVSVGRVIAIGDDPAAITREIDAALREYDIIITTGGLGPTHDDLSKKVFVEYFGGNLVFNEKLFQRLKAYFEERGYSLPAGVESQAWLPDNADILPNRVGSAQGMLFRKHGKKCFVLPGVPAEMEYISENSILPMLQQEDTGEVHIHHTWRTAGIPESKLAEMLGDVAAIEHYGKLAFLPKYGGVDLRLSIRAPERTEAESRRQAAEKIIVAKIGKFIYATGDTSLESLIGKALRQRGQTLAIAESCTGGMLCQKITSVAGSSDYFLGGIIAYSNREKMARLGVSAATLAGHGAVSEATAIEMARGARDSCGADYALSTTGIAGPGGGSAEKPVGLVFIGLATPEKVEAKRFVFSKSRIINQERSVATALLMLHIALKS